ncbi:MAG: GNAT family N-acetyltransferase [Anaerolineae bacterium]|nr:GNAT family N-acetyltransferase [Anaerolineae bacterium]
MSEDPIAEAHWDQMLTYFPQHQVVLVNEDDRALGRGYSLPTAWSGIPAELPDRGWDAALETGVANYLAGHPNNVVSAIEITLRPELRGQGLSRVILSAMKTAARAAGYQQLIAPVRPTLKARYPLTPMPEYITWTEADGSAPFDPWLRVHWRAGASIARVAPQSMTIPGSVAQWEHWTGMRFPASGRYAVPEALEPIEIDRAADRGLYVEPNVWMVHPL